MLQIKYQSVKIKGERGACNVLEGLGIVEDGDDEVTAALLESMDLNDDLFITFTTKRK